MIAQIDVDLWIFENQYTPKHKGTQWNCGFLYFGLSNGKALTAQNDVDLWIFGNTKIKTQKLIVTVRKMLGICGFLLLTYTMALSGKNHILRKWMWICGF